MSKGYSKVHGYTITDLNKRKPPRQLSCGGYFYLHDFLYTSDSSEAVTTTSSAPILMIFSPLAITDLMCLFTGLLRTSQTTEPLSTITSLVTVRVLLAQAVKSNVTITIGIRFPTLL